MKLRTVNEVDLGIDADTVRLFAEKARAISSGVTEEYEDGREHEIEFGEEGRDSHRHDGLMEEEEEDLTEDELRALIADLNVDEAAALVALAWIGRGDYSGDEWEDALTAARGRANTRTADYLLGMPMLGEWLEEGLEAVGA